MSDAATTLATTLYFNSGVGVSELSNFAESPVYFRGIRFVSAEHAFQAVDKVVEEDWKRFALDGDLGTLEKGLKCVFSEKEYQKKLKHYGAKRNRPSMPGIVAKMAVKPEIARRLRLRLNRFRESEDRLQEMKALFHEILRAKYTQNESSRKALLGTENHHLVEFSRGAERETKQGRPPLWTGMVVGGRKEGKTIVGGELVGTNLQGDLQMEVRAALRA